MFKAHDLAKKLLAMPNDIVWVDRLGVMFDIDTVRKSEYAIVLQTEKLDDEDEEEDE